MIFFFFSVNTSVIINDGWTHRNWKKKYVDTHLVRMTAQKRTCKDCGKKHWGPRSPRNRAACPAALGPANRTAAAGEEGEAAGAGRAAEGSGTGMKALSGYSPSWQRGERRARGTRREQSKRQTGKSEKHHSIIHSSAALANKIIQTFKHSRWITVHPGLLRWGFIAVIITTRSFTNNNNHSGARAVLMWWFGAYFLQFDRTYSSQAPKQSRRHTALHKHEHMWRNSHTAQTADTGEVESGSETTVGMQVSVLPYVHMRYLQLLT